MTAQIHTALFLVLLVALVLFGALSSDSATHTASKSSRSSVTSSATPSYYDSPMHTESITPTLTASLSLGPPGSETPAPSITSSNSRTPSKTSSASKSSTGSISVTNTPSSTISTSSTPTKSPTVTISVTKTLSKTSSASRSSTGSISVTNTPSSTISNSRTPSKTSRPSSSPTKTPSISITPTISTTPSTPPTSILMTFEGMQNSEYISNYYNGGTGSLGDGPGPNFKVTYGPCMEVVYATNLYTDEPSSVNIGWYGCGIPQGYFGYTFLNSTYGFETLTGYYSAPFTSFTLNFWDATGGVFLGNVFLPKTTLYGCGPNYPYCPFSQFFWSSSNPGVYAYSVTIGGNSNGNGIAFDNIGLESLLTTTSTPTPSTSFSRSRSLTASQTHSPSQSPSSTQSPSSSNSLSDSPSPSKSPSVQSLNVIFATSHEYLGDLSLGSNNYDNNTSYYESTDGTGLAGADSICNQYAREIPGLYLNNGFKAVMSDDFTSANSRFNSLTGPVYLADQATVVVTQVSSLWNGNGLVNPIKQDQLGNSDLPGSFQTGSDYYGNSVPGLTCNNWTTSGSSTSAEFASPSDSGHDWQSSFIETCDYGAGMYCLGNALFAAPPIPKALFICAEQDLTLSAYTRFLSDLGTKFTVTRWNTYESAGYGTPTVSQLQQYDLVIVSMDYSPSDPFTLGNNLYSYLSYGIVIVTDYSFLANVGVKGYILTQLSFTPIANVNVEKTVVNPVNNPLFLGVNTLTCSENTINSLKSGATGVAYYNDGSPVIAYTGNVLSIACAFYNGLYNGSWVQLMYNFYQTAEFSKPSSPSPPPVPPYCAVVNGVMWCYDPNACGEACSQVCESIGMTISVSSTEWFEAQDSQAECDAIAIAFSLSTPTMVGSYTYACVEDDPDPAPREFTHLYGTLSCSTYSACSTLHLTNMDNLGIPCSSPANRKSLCPCSG